MSIQSAVGNLTEAVDKLTATTNVPASTLTTKVSNIQADQATAEASQTTAEGHVTTADGHVTDAQGYLTTTKSGATYDASALDALGIVDKKAIPIAFNDVFVYDTSLDSDGGAWRKRTQHTSWYNEDKATGKWLGVHASESEARNANATLGAEQVTNGTFNTDLSGWTATGSGTATWSDGQVHLQNAVTFEQQPVTTGSGTFRLTWNQTVERSSQRTRIRIRNSADTADVGPFNYYYGSGEFSVEFSTTTGVTLQIYIENGHSAYIDNVSLREITAQTTTTGDYYQDSTNGRFYTLEASGVALVYRGARSDFPAVALLVATDLGVIVYDADDSTLPMWADWRHYFVPVGGFPSYFYASDTKSVRGLNGYICHVGARNEPTNGGGLRKFNLIADTAELVSAAYGSNRGYITQGLSRDSLGAYSSSPEVPQRAATAAVLPSAFCNDLDMRVRDSAPVDDTTGLPKPTIVVAHNSGASVMHEADTITSTFFTGACTRIALSPNAEELVVQPSSTPYSTWRYAVDNLTSTGYEAYWAAYYFPRINFLGGYTDFAYGADTSELHVANGYPYTEDFGYYQIKRGTSNSTYDHNDLYCKTDVAYTTGWMPAKTRVATLGGIDSDTLDGTPIISNIATSTTDFSQAPWMANTANVTITNGNEIYMGSLYSGVAYPLFPSASADYRPEHIGVIEVELDITHVSGTNNDFALYTADLHNNVVMFNLTANTRQTVTLQMYPRTRMRGEHFTIQTRTQSGNWPTVIIHSVTVTQKAFVRNTLPFETPTSSYQSYTPIYVNGVFNRAPVATGAELVGKTSTGAGWLVRPYNPDLDFLQDVANDYTVMFWGVPRYDNAWSPHVSMSNYNAAKYCWWGVQANKPAIGTTQIGSEAIAANQLYHFCFVNRGGTLYAYLNGRETGSVTLNSTFAAPANQSLVIGARHGNSGQDDAIADPNRFDTSALLKIAGNAITAEQVRFIYESERELFKENAACTLFVDSIPNNSLDYGLVTTLQGAAYHAKAVSYDRSTDTTHVVTGSGRSSFKGLVRTNYSGSKWEYSNYTINTAVSASNGLIIEG